MPVTPTTEVIDPRAKWRAFAAIALSFVTIVFSMTMAFLVLPSISEDFDVTLRAVGWFVIIDALIVSALLLPLGALADTFGRKRVLLVGMTVFGIGSVLTGLAPTFGLLLGARVIMSIGNALVQSIATGLLVAAFPPEERGLAIGAQTTAVAVGSATGPLIAGLALDVINWDTLFILLVIPSAVSTAGIWFLIERDPPRPKEISFDRGGSVLAAAMITVIVVTINDPLDLGWLSPAIILGAVIAVALITGFIRWELRQPKPMLELRLFAIPVFRWAVVVRVVAFLASTVTSFLFPIYLLQILGLSSARTGVVLSCVAVGMGVCAQVSGRVYDRVGPRLPTVVGLVLQIGVNIGLAMSTASTSLTFLALVAVLNGIAVGLWNVPLNSAMLGATPPEQFGVGGAFTNVTRTVGNVLGQALAAVVVASVMASRGFDIPLGDIDETAGAAGAFLDGWRLVFLFAAGVTTLATVAASRLPGQAPKPRRLPAHEVSDLDAYET